MWLISEIWSILNVRYDVIWRQNDVILGDHRNIITSYSPVRVSKVFNIVSNVSAVVNLPWNYRGFQKKHFKLEISWYMCQGGYLGRY